MTTTGHTLISVDFDPFEEGKEIEKIAPVTEPQKEIWLSCVIGGNEANLAYNESVSLELEGIFFFPAFQKAADHLILRHEALRCTISADGENLIIYKNLSSAVTMTDISGKGEQEQQALLKNFLKQQMNTHFDLQEGPLIRLFVHKLGEKKHYFTLVKHHIIGDGWSTGIILEDLSKMYNAWIKNENIQLPPPPQISDYAHQQAAFAKTAEYKAIEQYWLKQYEDEIPVLDLPTDHVRKAPRSYKGSRYDYPVAKEQVATLKATGARAGCSLVNTLLSAFEIFLYYKTGQQDIVVGLPAAGQSATGNFGLVGHCVNLMPLRTKIDPDSSFMDYLKKRKKAFFDAYDHQRITFGELVKKLPVKRDNARIPMVPVVFNIDMGMDNSVVFDGLNYRLISNPRDYETFEIFLNATGSRGSLILEWSYNTQLFERSTIRQMMNEFESLLQSFIHNPEQKIKECKRGNDANNKATEKILEWNSTFSAYPKDKIVTSFISEIAKHSPDKVAAWFNDQRITYKSLNDISAQLAAFLADRRVKKGDIIAVAIDRSVDMLLAMLGILKAGAAYLPIDPEYPKDRVEFMLTDANAKMLLTEASYKGHFKSNASEIIIEEVKPLLSKFFKKDPDITVNGNDLAYVLYTSGSTGKPKGVQIEHHNLTNLLVSMQQKPGIHSGDRLLAITTISFDISGLELYLPLITGAELVIADTNSIKDPRLLMDLIAKHNISFMQATPSTWQMLYDAGWKRKNGMKLLSGGEALSKDLAEKMTAGGEKVWNVYGPTETTIWSAIKCISDREEQITIGRPIDNTQIYILDENRNLLSPGATGEIYIGGDGVARGYLNRPELTSERFVRDPFSADADARLYRTGDLGKLLEDGEIQCLGRMDHQVKIRGHRIELGEIEYTLSTQKGIKQAVVTAREDQPGNQRLVAYVIEDDQASGNDSLSWKERWDTIYDMGAKSKQNLDIAEQKIDGILLEQWENSEALKLQAAEWIQQSVERIKKLLPQRVVEIGSGAGQILFEVAPGIESYIATDYADAAITNLKKQLSIEPEKWQNVLARTAAADDFTGIAPQSQDLVLIHSVAQYFPTTQYLIKVIEESVKAVRKGGCVFIGDMQGMNSLDMFHAMDQLRRSGDNMAVTTFKEVVKNRVRIEDELTADPGFFYLLQERIPAITAVDIQLRKGQTLNETTKYHYDVWLYVNDDHHYAKVEKWIDWQNYSSIEYIEKVLTQNASGIIQLTNIPNQRTAKDYALLQLLQAEENASLTIKEIKQQIHLIYEGIDPDIFREIAKKTGFEAHIRWSTDGTDGLFEVVFIPAAARKLVPEKPQLSVPPNATLEALARTPLAGDSLPLSREKIEEWKKEAGTRLPAYMIPDDFVSVKRFPLTPNNKIDRKALPKPAQQAGSSGKQNRQPRTEAEKIIASIWQATLGIENISIDEDFFELGGHSLIAVQVMTRIEKQTGKRLPLATLFENSTIEKLAEQLSGGEPVKSWEALVPIRTTGSKTPLFLIHGGGLNVLLFKSISEYLDKDQPVYGIQALGLNHPTDIPLSMEEISSRYIKEILAVQPEGPYALAGYSLGGFIAFEIARQLKAMGREIKLLGVMDTYAGSRTIKSNPFIHLSQKAIRQFRKIPFFTKSFIFQPKEAFNYQLTIMKNKMNKTFNGEDIITKDIMTDYEKSIYKSYDIAHNSYFLQPSDVKLTLFRVEKRLYYLDDLIYLGWNKFAKKGVEVHKIPGDHKTFLFPPNDRAFAEILQRTLDNK